MRTFLWPCSETQQHLIKFLKNTSRPGQVSGWDGDILLLTLPEVQQPGGARTTNTQNEDVDRSNLWTVTPNKITDFPPSLSALQLAGNIKLDKLSQGSRVHLVFYHMSKSCFWTATPGRSYEHEIQRDALCFPQNLVLAEAVLNPALRSQKEGASCFGDEFEKGPFEAEPGTCLHTPTLHLTHKV